MISDAEYYQEMTAQCREIMSQEWDSSDDSVFKNKQIPERIDYLKKWFCCSLCQVRVDNCEVFQEKLNGTRTSADR